MAIQFERDLDIGNNKIRNLDDPALDTDAATKGYVDTRIEQVSSLPSNNYATDIGDGTSTVFDVNHGLGTTDVRVTLFYKLSGEEVDIDVDHFLNSVRLTFGAAPIQDEFRCVINGIEVTP